MICTEDGLLAILFVGALIGVLIVAVIVAVMRSCEFGRDAAALRRMSKHGEPPSATRMGR